MGTEIDMAQAAPCLRRTVLTNEPAKQQGSFPVGSMRSWQWPVLLVLVSLVLHAGVIAFQTLRLTPGQTLFRLFGSSGKPLRDGTRGRNTRVEKQLFCLLAARTNVERWMEKGNWKH